MNLAQSQSQSELHKRYMRLALMYAARNRGITGENPSVGCVIVNGHNIVGVSATGNGGVPHAEVCALAMAGGAAKGATAYVTLEPCCHHGKTPPCVDALITAGVQQVIVAMRDPNPKVSGGGIAALKGAGITVLEGVCEKEARHINRGFFKRIEKALPWVSMKLATSMDGKIALSNGDSKWITGAKSRQYGHYLRAKHDAVITGMGTVSADNPSLTCRLNGMEDASPIRVVLDSNLSISMDSQLIKTARQVPLWIVTTSKDIRKKESIEEAGAVVMESSANKSGYIDITILLNLLAKRGVNSVLVEAGEALSTSFIREKMVDELYWFQAPVCLGGDSRSSIGALSLALLQDANSWRLESRRMLGHDIMSIIKL